MLSMFFMSPELSMIIINYQKAIAMLTGLSIVKATVYPHTEHILQDCTYPGIVCLGLCPKPHVPLSAVLTSFSILNPYFPAHVKCLLNNPE